MNRSLLLLCVCGALVCPGLAWADAYQFVFTSGGTRVSFDLPGSAVPYTTGTTSVFYGVAATFESTDLGFGEESKEIEFYYGSGTGRPISIDVASVYGGHDGDLDFDETGDAVIFSGPSSAAMFVPGTYTFPMGYETIGEVANLPNTYGDTLTVSLLGSGTAATPEPGMLVLVGSGVLAGAARTRRRFRRG